MPESVPPTALPRLPTNPTVGAAALKICNSLKPTLFEEREVPAVVNRTLDDQIPFPRETVEPLVEIDPVTLTTVPSENERTPEVTVLKVLGRP